MSAFFSITYEDFGIVLKGDDGSEYIASFPTDRASSKKIKVYKRTGELTTDIYSVQPSVSQSPVHFFNTEGSKGDVTLTFSSAGRAVALIITDGNGRGSSMMYVSGLSKYINKLAGDSSPSWSEDGSALTLKSTDWNNIIVVTGTSVEFSVAP